MGELATDTVVVPVASEDDAERTCAALEGYVGPEDRIVVVHVVEKADGAPDKASVEQRETVAEKAFLIARQRLETERRDVETKVLYGSNVVDTIFAAAEDVDADLVAFSPREAGRLARLLSGDVAYDLIVNADRPVLVLPQPDEE